MSLSKLAHDLFYIGGKLRSNLKDASVVYPENWHKESVDQLIEQWDEAAAKYVDAMMKEGKPQ